MQYSSDERTDSKDEGWVYTLECEDGFWYVGWSKEAEVGESEEGTSSRPQGQAFISEEAGLDRGGHLAAPSLVGHLGGVGEGCSC